MRSGVFLHPYFTVRLAGLPAEAALLASGATAASIESHVLMCEEVERLCKAACEALETFCSAAPDQSSRRALLDVKRSFHNLRIPTAAAWTRLTPALPPPIRELTERCRVDLARWRDGGVAIGDRYVEELDFERAGLRRLYDVPAFRAALEISNPLLAARLGKLFSQQGNLMSDKDRGALWLSLAAYALRAACKTSPQSSFGTVAVGVWSDEAEPKLPCFGAEVRSRFDLRKAPMEQLLSPLLRRVDALDPTARIRLNPSVRVEDGKLQWLRVDGSEKGNDRTLGAIASSMKLEASRALQAVLSLFKQTTGADRTLSEMRERLRENLPSSLRPNIEAMLQRLFDLQLVEAIPNPQQISALETWRRSSVLLNARLRSVAETALLEVERRLNELARQQRGKLPALLRDAERAYEQLAAAIDQTVRAEDYRPIVHDDCTLPELSMAPAALGGIIGDLGRLLDLTCLLGGTAGYGRTGFAATALFLESFGRDGVCTDVESFLSEVANRSEPQVKPGAAGPGDVGVAHHGTSDGTSLQVERLSDELAFRLAAVAETGSDRDLDWSFFEPFIDSIPDVIRRRAVSHCINGQIVSDGPGAARFVINQIYPGRSRMISRFLPDRPELRERVRDYLGDVSCGRQPIAIPGVFGFNANLHARFLESEFDIGPFPPDRDDTRKVSLADLTLHFDPAIEQLVVDHVDGTPMQPLYLGILMSQRLPALHRTLDAITGASEGVTPIWLAIARKMGGFQEKVTTVPRLAVGSILIARRSHYVPRRCFPDCSMSNIEFFKAIQEWRARHGVPRRVFYHRRLRDPAFSSMRLAAKWDDAQRQRMRMMFKPIYADLSSPTCVQLMRMNLAREDEDLIIAEALPSLDDASSAVAGQGTVSELSFELTRSGS